MGFAPLNRAVRSASNRYSRQNAGRKKPVTTQTKNAPVVHFSWKRNGLRRRGPSFAKGQLCATGLFPMGVAVPRNKLQQFRPAGTRVAPPGTKRHSRKTESSVQDVFCTSCISFREREQFAYAKRLGSCNEIQKVFLDYFKP